MSSIPSGNVGTYGATRSVNTIVDRTTLAPFDRIRWGPIVAGLFGALTVMAVLGALGVAVGLSSVDAGERASSYGMGAGIWGIISALIAFFVGGWIASSTTARRCGCTGVMQGAMVWMVTIPLLIYLLAGGIGMAVQSAEERNVNVISRNDVYPDRAGNAALDSTLATGNLNAANDTRLNTRDEANARTGAKTAWGTFGNGQAKCLHGGA